jgi:class 3 adenylate cyclase
MPIFLDRHDMVDQSAEETAKLHLKDLEVQEQYGVKFLTYWYDAERRTTFCLVDAPDKETADRVHAEAHGHVANQMIEVDLSAVEAFLGRIHDPPTARSKAIDDSAFRAIMFTDMVGSTELTSRLGDAMSMELLRAHDAIIRRCLERYHGSEVKHLGDGIMASFEDAPASVNCAIEILEELASYNENSRSPISIRIGIDAGEPVVERNDLFGSVVQKAARICDGADKDSILVSQDLRDACAGADLVFSNKGAKELKGFREPIELYHPAR